MPPLALLLPIAMLATSEPNTPRRLTVDPSWKVEEPALVKQEGETVSLRREGIVSGRIAQEIDLSGCEGKQYSLTFDAKVSGGVSPWFEVRSLDGKLSFVAGGLKLEPTDLLTEHNRFGWYFDFRYGWPVNPDLPHLFRGDWQKIGGIFTVPKGVKRVSVRFGPKPVKYGLIDRRPEVPRNGEVVLKNIQLAQVSEVSLPSGVWEKENLDNDSFLYLSYFYNQQQITLSRLQLQLWRLDRWASGNHDLSAKLQSLAKDLQKQRAALKELSDYYHSRFSSVRSQVDLKRQMTQYSEVGSDGSLIDIGTKQPFYLSLYIQDLIDSGFALRSPAAKEIANGTQQLETNLRGLEDQLLISLKANPAPELAALSYAEKPATLPPSGKTPAILYATGNTTVPLRVHKDLGVDLFSKNYPVATFDDTGLKEDRHLPSILKRYGMKQISCLFTPVHGLFAVSDAFLKEYDGRWREFLREEAPGVAAIHARDRKSGKRDVLKLNLDTFKPEAGKSYILPINPLSPMGHEMLVQRMGLIRKHIEAPANREVLAAIELSAEPTGVVGVSTEPHTRAAFVNFIRETAGSIESVNQTYGSALGDFEALADAPPNLLPERLLVQRERWDRAFHLLQDSLTYQGLQKAIGTHEIAFLHRNNDLYFSDEAWKRVQLKDDYINYHAAWDRVYGYDLGQMLGKDHITGEDHPALPTGLKDRHTEELAIANLLKSVWGYAEWGTKVVQLWRPYKENAFHSIATFDSGYTLANINWTFLPIMKEYTRGIGAVLDGEVAARKVAYLQLQGEGHITWYTPSVYTTNQFLRRQQVPYAYLFEEALKEGKASLNDYRVLFVPPSLFVSQAMQEHLWQWVENGGQLVLFGPMGLHDKASLPSSWLMDRAFGPAEYRLVGTSDQVRRPNQEGLWTINWKEPKPAQVSVVGVNSDLPLPPLKGTLYEKKWNDFDEAKPVKDRAAITAESMKDALYVSSVGKGKVILIPREMLLNGYATALAETLGDLAPYSWAQVDQPNFNVMRRKAKGGDGGTEYLILQNEDEWQGERSATVSLSGEIETLEDVSDLRNAVPVSTIKSGDRRTFQVTLKPGEIVTFRLRSPHAP